LPGQGIRQGIQDPEAGKVRIALGAFLIVSGDPLKTADRANGI